MHSLKHPVHRFEACIVDDDRNMVRVQPSSIGRLGETRSEKTAEVVARGFEYFRVGVQHSLSGDQVMGLTKNLLP